MPATLNLVENRPTEALPFPSTLIAGIPVHHATMAEVLDYALLCVRKRRRCLFGMLNIAKLVKARDDPLLMESLLQSDVVLADGVPVVWLSHLQRDPLPERVAGIDLMYRLLDLANHEQLRVFFLGAREHVSQAMVERVAIEFPRCVIAGRRNGYFSAHEEPTIVDEICRSTPDILFVAMSPPKKELFMAKWGTALRVPVCHGVGGSFDVFAGIARRAPLWMQHLGLEWLYRVYQEPRRMWRRYLVTNIMAIPLFLRAALRGLHAERTAHV